MKKVVRAEAQSTEVKTEFLMTYFTPYERHPIDGSFVVANVKPGGWASWWNFSAAKRRT